MLSTFNLLLQQCYILCLMVPISMSYVHLNDCYISSDCIFFTLFIMSQIFLLKAGCYVGLQIIFLMRELEHTFPCLRTLVSVKGKFGQKLGEFEGGPHWHLPSWFGSYLCFTLQRGFVSCSSMVQWTPVLPLLSACYCGDEEHGVV